MYRSILTASDTDPIDLVDLDTVKDELAITDAASDDRLARWITDASAAVNAYVGRVLRAQDVVETFSLANFPRRNDGWWPERCGVNERLVSGLNLRRYPIVSITSVVDEGATLVAGDDYEADTESGLLYRMSGSGQVSWGGYRIVVTYRGGWDALTDVPGGVRSAVLQLISYRKGARGRDPALRQISIPGVVDKTFFAGQPNAATGPVGGLPPDIAAAVAYLRDVPV